MSKLMSRFRRSRSVPDGPPLTLEELIAAGIVKPPKLSELRPTKRGFWLTQYRFGTDELGRQIIREGLHLWWPYSWNAWRHEKVRQYHGMEPRVAFRDLPSGIREPVLNVGPGSSDIEQRVAKSLMIDSGQAKPAYNTDQELSR